MLSKSFKAGKCKTSLKLAVARIKLLKNKRDVQVKQMRRDLAQLLETGKDQTARIRVEHVIREEKTVSAYELIELYCELIVARLTIIESQKSCPIDLREAICSVIFASPRCADLPELLDVRKHFTAKYGKEFATSALELRPDCGVSRLIVEKLSAKAPDIETKIKVLTAIAEEHNIKWEPKAFEEQVQKPSEDLLQGPSSFTYKIPVESSTVQFPPPSADKHKSVTKHTVTDVDRSSFGSNSFSSPASVDTASQPGPRAAASTYDRGETGHTHFREEVTSSTRQKWTMEFKDATSAAQAAAESAERASMAARAAVELASRGNDPEYSNRSRDSSNYRSKHEAGNLTGSKFQGVSPTRDSVRNDHNIDEATYATKQRMHSMESQRVQDHMAGDPKSVNEDSKDTRSQYGRNASSASTRSSSEKGATEEIWRQKEIVEDESSGEEFAERHPIRPVSSSSSNHSYDGDVSVSDLQNSDRYASESFFKVDPINRNMSQRIDASDAGRGQIERKSSKSFSHSTVNSIDHEKVLDSVSSIGHEKVLDSPVHENYASQHSLFGSGKEINQDDHKPGLSVDAPAFDQSDGESDEHGEIENFMEKDDFRLTSRHTEANFHVPSSNMDYSALDQLNNNFRLKDGSSSSLRSVSRLHPAEVSGVARRDDPSPQSNAVAYDVSDGASSDAEDEVIGFGDRGDTVSHSLHNKKNAGKYEHRQSLSRSSLKDTVTMDKLDQFSSSSTDANTEFHSSDAGGHELNFGRLSGGFRNKGFIRPPYLKSTVVDESLPSETSTDDSSKKPSPKAKIATFEDAGKSAHNRKSHFRSIEGSRSRSRNSIDSDTGVEDLEQHPASGSRPYHTAGSTLSTTKLDGKLSIGDKEKASSTLMRPESNEISQEKPHRRSSWRTSKESGHASVVACVDEDIEKQTLSPVGRDTSHILPSQKLEGTKTAVPSTTRISGVADIYDNKTSVRTSKGPISTAASIFDEENDKEVFKSRDVAANLGIRSGRRLSQRTKDSKVNQLSNSGGSSDLESKSLRSTSSISETSSKPSTSSVKPEKNRTSKFLPPEVSVEQHPTGLSEAEILVQKDRLLVRSVPETPFKPSTSSVEPDKSRTPKSLPPNISTKQHSAKLIQDEVLVQKDGLEPSQRGSSYNNQSVPVQTGVPASNETVKPSTSRENSLNDSHVHPKLPDYETFADYFKSLRSNRR